MMNTKHTVLYLKYTAPDLLQYGFGPEENLARCIRPTRQAMAHHQQAPQVLGNELYTPTCNTQNKHTGFLILNTLFSLTPFFLFTYLFYSLV